MRKEIGKWFMDIAKYVATAILISSFLGRDKLRRGNDVFHERREKD